MKTPVHAEPVPLSAAPRCRLAESPRWLDGQWWWVDATDGRVWTSRSWDGPPTLAVRSGHRVSMVQPVNPGAAVIADTAVLRTLHLSGNRWHIGNPVSLGLGEGWILNDGCADMMGRVWIGAIAPDRSPGSGCLLWTDGTRVRVVHDDITISNGMAFSADGATLYHADTGEQTVLAHRVDATRGVITHTEVRCAWDEARPDGLALDTHGGLWVALYGTSEILRLAPGEAPFVAELPTPQVTSLAFGGQDGRDLLITTAREGFDEEASRADPWAGRIFHARAPYPGAATFRPRIAPWPA